MWSVCGLNNGPPRRTPRRRPCLETLEDRTAPALFTVTTTADTGTGSLRAAVDSANSTGGSNTITFASPLTGGQTITLTSNDTTNPFALGPTALVIAPGDNLTIAGDPAQAGITISGNNSQRLFGVLTGGTLTLQFLTITGGRAQGGNGGSFNLVSPNDMDSGGGGAAGLGGAVFNAGTLNLVQSTVTGNQAVGGNGGSGGRLDGNDFFGGGGGGGLGGNGGQSDDGGGGGGGLSGNGSDGSGAVTAAPAARGGGRRHGGPERRQRDARHCAWRRRGAAAVWGPMAGVAPADLGAAAAAPRTMLSGPPAPAAWGAWVEAAGGAAAPPISAAAWEWAGGAGGFGAGAGGGGGGFTVGAGGAAGFGAGTGGAGGLNMPDVGGGGGGGGGAGLGGAVFNDGGTVTITNSTLTGNQAVGGTGGSAMNNGSHGGAGANGQGLGGAVFNRNGSFTVLYPPLGDNTTAEGGGAAGGGAAGGIVNVGDGAGGSAALTLTNSIVSGSTATSDVLNTISNGGAGAALYATAPNIVQTVVVTQNSSTTTNGSGVVNTDPMLAAAGLASNGGPTQTIAATTASSTAALKTGATGTGVTTDQRGTQRSSPPDLGAYQYSPAGVPTAVLMSDGELDLYNSVTGQMQQLSPAGTIQSISAVQARRRRYPTSSPSRPAPRGPSSWTRCGSTPRPPVGRRCPPPCSRRSAPLPTRPTRASSSAC